MIGSVCASKAVEEFEMRRQYKKHKQKIHAAKSTVNNVWSTREQEKLLASRRNPKREQSTYERCDEIEKENTRLLLRFLEIGEQKPQIVARGAASEPKRSAIPPARRKEIQRINEENAKLYKRIQGAKPSIDRVAQREDHKRNQKIMHLRCEHQPESARRKERKSEERPLEILDIRSPASSEKRSAASVTPRELENGAAELEDGPVDDATSGITDADELDYDKVLLYGVTQE
eukprot:GEMP01057200.1.p1 GENE.GEMP01057200.1~~GEMP01057200.1.p1  ORF type:complete len:232 (+),score=57.98 GEMP01057200.1:68-763(+)